MFGRRNTTSQSVEEPKEIVLDDMPEEFQQLFSVSADEARSRKSVESLLLERKHITEEQLLQAKQVQSQTPGKTVAQILLTMNAATEAQILSALAETQGMTFET